MSRFQNLEPLQLLLEAKRESDRKNYGAKDDILARLLRERPDDFVVDDDKRMAGLTHKPTGFRIHSRRELIPPTVFKNAEWREVPAKVEWLTNFAAEPVSALRVALPNYGFKSAFWHPTGELFITGADEKMAWPSNAVLGDNPPGFKEGTEPWVLVKRGDPITTAAADAMQLRPNRVNELIGGPSPLAAMLSGGALGAAAGYGTGALLEKIAPSLLNRGRLRRTGTIAGGLLGATPGAWWLSANLRKDDGEKKAADSIKEAFADFGTGALDVSSMPTIPKNQFGQSVWDDENTPIPIRAAANGLLASASQLSQSPGWISPADVARVAIGMGSGWGSGLVVGKTLGALAGLNQNAQDKLKQTGAWAGVLTSVVPMAFGRN